MTPAILATLKVVIYYYSYTWKSRGWSLKLLSLRLNFSIYSMLIFTLVCSSHFEVIFYFWYLFISSYFFRLISIRRRSRGVWKGLNSRTCEHALSGRYIHVSCMRVCVLTNGERKTDVSAHQAPAARLSASDQEVGDRRFSLHVSELADRHLSVRSVL